MPNPEVMKGVWNGIWRLKVPPRIRSLIWLAGSESLPTKVNLVKRKLLTETLCPHCKLEPKDTVHALWSYPAEVCQVQFATLRAATASCNTFLDIIQLAQQDQSCFDLIAMIVSLIWMRRNKARVGEDTYPLAKINSMAGESLQEFQKVCPIHTKIPRTARSVRWRPPPNGSVKVNFDGALFPKENVADL